MPSRTTPASAETLEPVELHALAIAAKRASKVRDALDEGERQRVDFRVRVHGHVDVAGASTANVRDSVKPATVLALVLDALGPKTTDKAVEGAVAACAAFVAGGEEPEASHEARLAADALLERCSRLSVQSRRGAVAGEVTVERLRGR